MSCSDCAVVIVNGVSLPGVSAIEERPVYVGDAERSVSGVLRPNFRTVAREWTVLLSGVSGVETRLLEEHLRTLGEVLVNVQGVECFALVTVNSKVRVPRLHSSWRGERDLVRSNWEILIRESQVETVLPGVSYQYAAFTDVGAFTWDWDAAGQPAEVDVLLVAGGGGGGINPTNSLSGAGGGGAGGVEISLGVPVSGDVSGTVGAGGAPGENGQNTSFGDLPPAIGGGTQSTLGGSGGGGGQASPPPGSGTPGQGHSGGLGFIGNFRGGGGGGGAGAPGQEGQRHPTSTQLGGAGGAGGHGIDLLAVGWNYRLIDGVPRFLGGGGGGGGGRAGTGQGLSPPGPGGLGGGGGGGRGAAHSDPVRDGSPGVPGTGGGGGGTGAGGGTAVAGGGGSGLVVVRWAVST